MKRASVVMFRYVLACCQLLACMVGKQIMFAGDMPLCRCRGVTLKPATSIDAYLSMYLAVARMISSGPPRASDLLLLVKLDLFGGINSPSCVITSRLLG